MATATAEVAAVADDEELAGYERLVGKRLYDEEGGIAAEIVAIHTAPSRGQKHEDIRATCLRLDSNRRLPECAITATGRVSRVSRLTRCLTHVPRLTPHLCLVFFRLCFRLPTLTPAPPDTGQNMLQCVRQGSRRRLWHQLNGPEYHISANAIVSLSAVARARAPSGTFFTVSAAPPLAAPPRPTGKGVL